MGTKHTPGVDTYMKTNTHTHEIKINKSYKTKTSDQKPGKPGLTLFQTTVNRGSSAAQREHPCSLKEETEQVSRSTSYRVAEAKGKTTERRQ